MMKKYILAAVLAVVGITAIHAQRMLRGQKGLELDAGVLSGNTPGKNYYLDLALVTYARNGNYWLWGMECNHQNAAYKDVRLPIETYTGKIGYSFQLLADARKIFMVDAGLLAVAGYENINRGNALLYDGSVILDRDSFVYGVEGRLSLETYLSDRFVLLLQGRTKVLWGTDLRQFRPSAGIGIRFNFLKSVKDENIE